MTGHKDPDENDEFEEFKVHLKLKLKRQSLLASSSPTSYSFATASTVLRV